MYVDPTIDLDETFKRNKKSLFDETNKSSKDIKLSEYIEGNIRDLNSNISDLEDARSTNESN